MDEKFLMPQGTTLARKVVGQLEPTQLTEGLFRKLIGRAMKAAFGFYADFLGRAAPAVDDTLVSSYLPAYQEAIELGLFRADGIAEKNHVGFWCLGKILDPRTYIESGVFTGSSLHAFLRGTGQCKITAIDPNLKALKIPRPLLANARLVDDQDFSQLDFETPAGEAALVYFDDHMDTANRILQACSKGLRYLLIDDSTGWEGVCQRLYPAVPTIPMILDVEVYGVGDQVSWSFPRTQDTFTRVTFEFDEALLEKCRAAKRHIRKCEKLPDLGDYLPQAIPNRTVVTTKYLLELQDAS